MSKRATGRGPIVTCKLCKCRFDRLEWMENTNCDVANCRCPSIKKARAMTKRVIEIAQESSRNRVDIQLHEVPHDRDDDTDLGQFYVKVPEVMTMMVTPSRKGK